MLQYHNGYTGMRGVHSADNDHAQLILFFVEFQIEAFIGEEKHVILKFSKCTADFNEATVLQPHNDYTDMRK